MLITSADLVPPCPSPGCSSLRLPCRQRLVEKAEAHMATIRYKAQPTVITYTSLIGMYTSIGDQKGAEDLLAEAEESGNVMDATIYTTLLTAYARLGLVPEAQKMMEKMESRGLQLDLLAYNGLLNAYVKAGEFTRADILLFTEMKRKKIRPNRVRPLIHPGSIRHMKVNSNMIKFQENSPTQRVLRGAIFGDCCAGSEPGVCEIYRGLFAGCVTHD